jgi:hypothetical protein
MTLRIYDSTLEQRVAIRTAAAEAANLCSELIANNSEIIKWADFKTVRALRHINAHLGHVRQVYEGLATAPPEDVEISPGLERELKAVCEPITD